MKTPLRYLLAAACLFTGMFAFAADEPKPAAPAAPAAEPSPDAAKAEALVWLKMVDDGKYEDSWKEAASLFQAKVSSAEWSSMLTQVRRPLGTAEKREFKDAKFTHELPRVPKGEYWIIQFATTFEGPVATIETVTPMLDKDGKWHVSGYFIKAAK
jgi:hypothetical protein